MERFNLSDDYKIVIDVDSFSNRTKFYLNLKQIIFIFGAGYVLGYVIGLATGVML